MYLDNASTTKLDPQVLDTMIEFMKSEYGNPSSMSYPQSISAKEYLKSSRMRVANLINCEEDEIIFTSGATESNNFIIKGVAQKLKHKGNHIITTKIEHKAVLEVCKYLNEYHNFEITYLDVDSNGNINLKEFEQSIKENTILVSIMWANNEIGNLNPIREISSICKEHNILFHTDATQALGKIKINTKDINIDFMSASAHKIYGPKGIGFAYIKNDELDLKDDETTPLPLLHGGEQEENLRAGTHSMHNIVGFAKACEIAQNDMDTYVLKLKTLEDKLIKQLKNNIDNIIFNGDLKNKVPGIINISIPNIENGLLIKALSDKYSLSAGSACTLGKPSYVLKAIGKENISSNTLRISLSKFSDETVFNLAKDLKEYIIKFS